MAYDTTSFDILRMMVQSTGTQFFNKDGSLNLQTPAVTKSLEVLKGLNGKGLMLESSKNSRKYRLTRSLSMWL